MPADKYDFKPTPEMRPFGELMAHIGSGTYFFLGIATGEDMEKKGTEPEQKTRDAVVPYLREAFGFAAEKIAAFDDARAAEVITFFNDQFTLPRAGLLEFMRDHVTHHLGYSVPYLRLAGVTKIPAYRFTGSNQSPA